MKFIAQILINAAAIFLADYLVPGFNLSDKADIFTVVVAGIILGLINFFIKPILKALSAPLIILSLGLFLIIINMGMLWLLDYFVEELTITGFWAYFWSTLLMSAVNIVFGASSKKKHD